MRLDRFEISKWNWSSSEKKFIWFEYLHNSCECRFLTLLNILFVYYSKDCHRQGYSKDCNNK